VLKKEDLYDRSKSDRYNEFAESLMSSCGGCFPLDEASDKSLREMFLRILDVTSPLTLVVQEQYVDRVYRDSYYIHYAAKHFERSRYCSRVFIFKGELDGPVFGWNNKDLKGLFIGCFVVRPTEYGIIGRTLIDPLYLFDKKMSECIHIRRTRYKVSFNGEILDISAFPYMMQDRETITCAETTIINLLDYYSNQYTDYRYCLPSDIQNVMRTYEFERALPSRGMSYESVSRVLYEFGFYPRLYVTSINDEEKQKLALHYYIESGIPVAVCVRPRSGNEMHSFVCIGHGKQDIDQMLKSFCSEESFCIANAADAYKDYIVQDDNKSPYAIRSFTDEDKMFGGERLEYLAVPLYRRMFLEIQDAFAVCKNIMLRKEVRIEFIRLYKEKFNGEEIGTKENPLILRLFIASTRSFLNWRIPRFSDMQTKSVYLSTPFPKFVCVCELYDLAHYEKDIAIGELIIDATSSAKPQFGFMRTVVVLNFPGAILAYDRNRGFPPIMLEEEAVKIAIKNTGKHIAMITLENWKTLEAYKGNLSLLREV
jgi:hypothetical protein